MDQKLKLKKFKKMRTASAISKIKVKLTYPPPISEYTPSKIKNQYACARVCMCMYVRARYCHFLAILGRFLYDISIFVLLTLK